MRLVLATTAVMVILAAVVLLWFDGPVEFTGYQLLLVTLGAMAVRRLRPIEVEEEDDSPLRLRIKPIGRPHYTVPPQLEKIERLVVFGKTTAFDAEWRLLPFVRAIATEQMEAKRGIDLAVSPEAARQVLGETGWELLDPTRQQPVDRMAPGLSLEELGAAVSAIEGI